MANAHRAGDGKNQPRLAVMHRVGRDEFRRGNEQVLDAAEFAVLVNAVGHHGEM